MPSHSLDLTPARGGLLGILAFAFLQQENSKPEISALNSVLRSVPQTSALLPSGLSLKHLHFCPQLCPGWGFQAPFWTWAFPGPPFPRYYPAISPGWRGWIHVVPCLSHSLLCWHLCRFGGCPWAGDSAQWDDRAPTGFTSEPQQ